MKQLIYLERTALGKISLAMVVYMFDLVVVIICSVLSVISSSLFCGFRTGFVYVDNVVFNGFCYALWAVFIINTFITLLQLRGKIKNSKLFSKKLFTVNVLLTVVNIACCIAFLVIGGSEELLNFYYVSFELMPYIAIFYGAAFLFAVYPVCNKLFQRITAIAGFSAMVIAVLLFLFPLGSFSFESAPAVFDTGDGYHIVFATNRESIGYVALDGDNENIIWDTQTGRKDVSRVHSIFVPYDELDNKGYTVGAVRSLENIAYGGHLGKEIKLDVAEFLPCKDDDFNMACITDNHACTVDWSSVAANADIYLFLGDIANGIYTKDSYINNLIIPAGTVSTGTKPVIFVRGNHDHRGSYVDDLISDIGFDKFYYRLNIGEYVFTVLDSGEDKEDDHYEYAGFNDYVSYFEEQLEWVNSLDRENGYNILLAHSPDIFDTSTEEISKALINQGIEFQLCGHFHKAEYVASDESETGISHYICGSKDGNKKLVYTMVNFSSGTLSISSNDTTGKTVAEKNTKLNYCK